MNNTEIPSFPQTTEVLPFGTISTAMQASAPRIFVSLSSATFVQQQPFPSQNREITPLISTGEVARHSRLERKASGSALSRITSLRVKRGKTLRRLTGFAVHIGKNMSRVALLEGDHTTLYDWPAEKLREKGILVEYQPFELDEVEIDVEGLTGAIAYEFRPLARVDDATIEPLPLNPEYTAKRDRLLARGKPNPQA